VCIWQPSIPRENGERNHGNMNVDGETLLKGFIYLVFVCFFVCGRSNCRNIAPIWTKFGVYLTDIDLRLPIKNGRYSSTDVTMATQKPLKLGLIHSNCCTIGPIWIKFGVYLTDNDLGLPIENGRYSSTDITMATEKLLKLGLIYSYCRAIGPIWMKFSVYLTDFDPILPI